jgi:hypothetical protein
MNDLIFFQINVCSDFPHIKTERFVGWLVVDKGMDDEHQCPTCGGRGFVPDDDSQRPASIN